MSNNSAEYALSLKKQFSRCEQLKELKKPKCMEASVIFPTAIFLLFQSSNCNLSVTAILTYNGCIGKQEKKGRSDKIHNVRRHLIGSYYGNLCVDTLVATDAINSAHLLQKLC